MPPIANADQAVIEPQKLRGYLLSRTHPVGRFKAIFFRSLGYSASRWQRLDADLRAHLLANDPAFDEETPFGRKYLVRGTLHGPNGRQAEVVAIWIILAGDTIPHFVTAFPGERK